MRPKALLYRLGEETEMGERLRAVLSEQKLLALTVDESQLGTKVGVLVSTNAAPAAAPAAVSAAVPDAVSDADPADGAASARTPQEPFLLFCSLGDRQLDRVLAAMRRAGVSVPRKAVLTEHNRRWTLGELMEQVEREHLALSGGAGGN